MLTSYLARDSNLSCRTLLRLRYTRISDYVPAVNRHPGARDSTRGKVGAGSVSGVRRDEKDCHRGGDRGKNGKTSYFEGGTAGAGPSRATRQS